MARKNTQAPSTQVNVEELKSLVEIQGQDGNWNYDSYSHGLYNGMELMLATVEGREPEYREAPEQWLSESIVDVDLEEKDYDEEDSDDESDEEDEE